MAPFWFPKSSQILPKIDPKMHQFFDQFLHRFFLHFSSNLVAKLEPCWLLNRLKWGDPLGVRPLFCWVHVLFRFFRNFGPTVPWGTPPPGLKFDPILAPFWLHLGSILEVWGTILAPFWCEVGAILGHLGARTGIGWAGGVTRSVKNLFLS